ncbi:MAG: hypothetical protein A2Y81_13400 [Nitrospirae bacterium RBG_13_43_8]|nr:MAG: hypothetical protein A2Y81_13400 [Nitrospirae bacterium RBG_13_43_8]
MAYYFVRVHGNTSNNNPNKANCYVEGEPPEYPNTYFNYYQFCLDNNIVRIGYPDIGDLLIGNKANALTTNCHDLNSIGPHWRGCLTSFSRIPLNSIILMPNKDRPGELYLGKVTKTYWYYHNVPTVPYECSHRLGVNWDRDNNGSPLRYWANDLAIDIRRGWWRRPFCEIKDMNIIKNIDIARRKNGF